MLVGIAGVLGFLALLVVLQVSRSHELVLGRLELLLHPVAEGLDLLAPAAQVLAADVQALGFELQGVFRPGARVETPAVPAPTGAPAAAAPAARPPLRTLSLVAFFLAPDRRTEAIVSSTSVVYERKSARGSLANDALSFASFGPSGEIVKTYNSRSHDFLGEHPTNSWRRLPGARSARALLAAHEAHLRERPFAVVALAPGDHERRFSIRHCEELWFLEARGLVRFDGPIVKGTRLLRLRSLLRVLGPGTAEARPGVALLLHALIGAAGALAAHEWRRWLPGSPETAVVATFLSLAAIALAIFPRSVIGSSLYVCIPAAVVFAQGGVASPWGWFAVAPFAILGNFARQVVRFRREKARQERLEAAVKARAAPPPASGA